MPFFSIIIPVYNASNYLRRLIKSIVLQTFDDYEVIFIDDGSVDGSAQICDAICKSDERFKYFYQSNGGAYAARNNGIERACGKYILFADADDSLKNNMFEEVYQAINVEDNKPDVVFFGKNEVNSNGKTLTSSAISSVKKGRLNYELLYELFVNNLIATTWNKAINKDFLGDISFKKRIIGEDYQFYLDILEKIPRVKIIPEILYNYYIENEDSLFKKYDPDRFDTLCSQHTQLLRIAEKVGSSEVEINRLSNDDNAYCLDRLVMNSFREDNKDSWNTKYKKMKFYSKKFHFNLALVNYPFTKAKKTKLFLARNTNIVKMASLTLLYKVKK